MKKQTLKSLNTIFLSSMLWAFSALLVANTKASEIDRRLKIQTDIINLLHNERSKTEVVNNVYGESVYNEEEMRNISLEELLNASAIVRNSF